MTNLSKNEYTGEIFSCPGHGGGGGGGGGGGDQYIFEICLRSAVLSTPK